MSRTLLLASVVALLPTSAFAYINAGFKSQAEYDRYMREQRLAEIGRATEAIQRDPKDPVAYYYRGNIYARENGIGDYNDGGPNYELALADYDRAIELDPKFAQAYFRRGKLRLWVHRLNRTPEMEEAERLPLPARLARLRELENTPQRRRKVAEALADVEKATELNPKLVEAQVFFAVHTDDPAKAIKAAKAACTAKEYRDEICLQLLAWAYARNGDFENAVHWQKKALELPVFGMAEAKVRLEQYRQHTAEVGGTAEAGGVYWYFVE